MMLLGIQSNAIVLQNLDEIAWHSAFPFFVPIGETNAKASHVERSVEAEVVSTNLPSDWADSTIIPTLELGQTPFEEACKILEEQINLARPGVTVSVRVDLTSIDPRVLQAQTNKPFSPITLNLRDIPVRDCARLM